MTSNQTLNTSIPAAGSIPEFSEILSVVRFILGAERTFFWLAIIYSIAISLLTLAVPISVQALISSVANTGLPQAVAVLAGMLFAVLSLGGVLVLLRYYLMERLQRRMYARLTSWIARDLISRHRVDMSSDDETLLVNRYFDIMTLKTHVPELLVGGVSVLLQVVVGATLVSMYHPLLLLYSSLLLISVYTVWRVWGPRAARSSVALSHAKYDTRAWLQRLGQERQKAPGVPNRNALTVRSNRQIADFLDAHARHFHDHFRQVIAFTVLSVVANAALLGLGGYLVILGELTLGQLVAAELVLSVILFGIGQFGYYLDKFYDICAATDELALLRQLAPGAHI